MNQINFDNENGFQHGKEFSIWRATARYGRKWAKDMLTPQGIWRTLRRRVPILNWLPCYNVKSNLLADVLAGVTLGIYNIPQGMAYSVLASLPPVYGLYASFFPPLLYAIFGSSFHTSIGVFSITCLMVGHARMDILPDGATSFQDIENLSPVEVVSALAFVTGLLQLFMWLFRLDFLTSYLSDSVINGFTFGAAVHAARSQIPAIMGVKVRSNDSQLFKLFRDFVDLLSALPNCNVHVVAISATSIGFLVITRLIANRFWKTQRIPFPSELLLLVGATIFSHFVHINTMWNVSIVKVIPTGMPPLHMPRWELFPHLIHHAISIAVVAFVITVSMGKMFAQKHKYSINPNQELLALGCVSITSSLFSVFPTSCSLSRTLVNEASGAKSQVSGIVAASITCLTILFIGPWLVDLPMCVLSSIVLVAIRTLLMKWQEVFPLYQVSKYDCATWIVSAAAVLLYDIVEGLVVGVVFAILTVVVRTQWPEVHEIGILPSGEFRTVDRFSEAKRPCVPILRFDAPLIFTNVERFKRALRQKISSLSSVSSNTADDKAQSSWNVIILDCSTWVYTDSMGIDAVKELIVEMLQNNVLIFFAEVRSSVLAQYQKSGLFKVACEEQFYPTTTHAVVAAEVARRQGEKFLEAAGLLSKLDLKQSSKS